MLFEEKEDYAVKNFNYECIYFLISKNEVVYVGQTKLGLFRVFEHKNKIFDEAKLIYCPIEKLDEMEDYFIKKYRPKYNKQSNNKMNVSLIKIKDYIRTEYHFPLDIHPKANMPFVKKILKKLNIKTDVDYYTGREIIDIKDFEKIKMYLGELYASKKS